MDLSLFQFDADLTFAAFFLNADRTVYARYGIRTSQQADDDVAIEGLAATMQKVLRLHGDYPANRASLAGKLPNITDGHRVPEDFPTLKHFKSELNYEGQVAKSCIHCHQVRDAQRELLRRGSLPLPIDLMFPYPSPKTIGIEMDPKSVSTIKTVLPESIAESAGLKPGDAIVSVNDQVIASAADLVWVLHNSRDGQVLRMSASRDGKTFSTQAALSQGWRKTTDLSWRPTSWDLRRMATGGAVFESTGAASPKDGSSKPMKLRVKHVGRYGPHARALKAGVRVGDFLVGVDNRTDLVTEALVIEYAMQEKLPGDSMRFKLNRDGKYLEATIRLQ